MLDDIEQLDLYEQAQKKIKKISDQYKKRRDLPDEEVYKLYKTIDKDVAINYHEMMQQETATEYDNTVFFIITYIQLKYLHYLNNYILSLKIRLGTLMKANDLSVQILDGSSSWIENGKASWIFFIDCMTMIGQMQHFMMIFRRIEKFDSTTITIMSLSKKNMKYSLEDITEKLKKYIMTRFNSNTVEMNREVLKEYMSENFMALGEPFR